MFSIVVGESVLVSNPPIKREILKFIVDHPAVFMIVAGLFEKPNVLFYGRLAHPEEAVRRDVLSNFVNFMRKPFKTINRIF